MAPQMREKRAEAERATTTRHPGGASGALALASVTAVLKSLLENGLANRAVTSELGGETSVSALPPDRVAIGAEERPQLNLFLYHVTPHTGLPAADGGAAPLSLELHYLLTAYGAQDLQTEILLGHALQLLHERPALARPAIREALAAVSSSAGGRVVSPALAALARSNLAERVERIRITPEFLSAEDMSKLWSSLQARYRPSVTFKVAAVVIAGSEDAG